MNSDSSNNPLGDLDSIENVNATLSYSVDNYSIHYGVEILLMRENKDGLQLVV